MPENTIPLTIDSSSLNSISRFIISNLAGDSSFARQLLTLYFSVLENGTHFLTLQDIWTHLGASTHLKDASGLSEVILTLPFTGNEHDDREFILTMDGHFIQSRFHKAHLLLKVSIEERLKHNSLKNTLHPEVLTRLIRHAFIKDKLELSNNQTNVIKQILSANFNIVTGGPGCGKTTLIVNIIRGLIYDAQLQHNSTLPKIRVLAPTGKAINRIQETLSNSSEVNQTTENQEFHEILAVESQMNVQCETLHQFFGIAPGTASLDHYPEFLLPDVLIIDECSMIPLNIMNMIFRFFPPHKKLILIGDPNQLPPVNEICILKNMLEEIQSIMPMYQNSLNPHVHILEMHRFNPELKNLIHILSQRDHHQFFSILKSQSYNAIQYIPLTRQRHSLKQVTGIIRNFLNPIHSALSVMPLNVSDLFNPMCLQYKILTPFFKGPFGSDNLNQICHHLLFPNGPDYHPGEPVMVHRNDYTLGLQNGEQGLLSGQHPDEELSVIFKKEAGFKNIPLKFLKHLMLSYAMTVHKAQGSEFDEILIFVPEDATAFLSLEWLYTAITRARTKVTIAGDMQSLAHIFETHNKF